MKYGGFSVVVIASYPSVAIISSLNYVAIVNNRTKTMVIYKSLVVCIETQ
jgi:hypothetical protein